MRTGPNRVSGDSPTATAAASSAPAMTAPRMPGSPSAIVAAGPAPSARSTPVSSAPARSCREMDWVPMISAASPAISPKTARAMASGRIARCACASMAEVT